MTTILKIYDFACGSRKYLMMFYGEMRHALDKDIEPILGPTEKVI